MYSRVRVERTLEYVLPGCGILYSRSTPYPGVAYSRVRRTRVWRTLEYATTKEECTQESKSCQESVAATPFLNLSRLVLFRVNTTSMTTKLLMNFKGKAVDHRRTED